MPLYQYVKRLPQPQRVRRSWIGSLFLMGMGTLLLFWVGWPIISFVTLEGDLYVQSIVRPIPDGTVLAVNDLSQTDQIGPDYTNPDVWFPAKPQKKVLSTITRYRLTIPTLGIENALTLVGGTDLVKSLIHYGGSANPGEFGTAIIFGHSTLPQLFDPLNYKTIFSTLPTLKRGDEFFIDYDGIRYRYRIFEMTVRDPSDLSELEQRFDDSYVTLVTCVPPGTYWKRLYVKAILIRPE